MKKMNGRKRAGVAMICIVLFFCAISFSAEASLRSAVFMFDMKSAFTMEYRELRQLDEHRTLYAIDEDTPVERATQNELTTWVVYSFGPFHYAWYYGEG